MPHIFLSYSRKDTDIMTRVRDDLRAAGFIVWTDENLTPGEPSWVNAIEDAIRHSDTLVVLLSPDARASIWVERERAFAGFCDVKVFPVLVRGSERDAVPLDLATAQWADSRLAKYDGGIASLITALRKHTGVVAPKRAEPDPTKEEIRRLSILMTKREKVEDWDVVIETGERILGLDPSREDIEKRTASAYFRRGSAAYKIERYDDAIGDFSRAIELDLGNALYYDYRGKVYHSAAAIRNSGGDYAKAITDKSKAIELDPYNADYYWERGMSYGNAAYYGHSIGDIAKAIAEHTHAIALNPHKADYYWERGKICHTIAAQRHPDGNYAIAIEDYTLAIERDSHNSDFYYARGIAYQSSGDLIAARRDFLKAAGMGHKQATQLLEQLK